MQNAILGITVGSVFVGISMVCTYKHMSFVRIAKKTEATITKVTRERVKNRTSDGRIYYKTQTTAYVKYEVNGKNYDGIVCNCKKYAQKGEQITILYAPDNPGKMQGNMVILPIIGFAIMGILGLIAIVASLAR